MLDQTETEVNLRTQFPTDRNPYTSDYDYDADSDLEEDEDWDYSNDEDAAQPVPEKSKGKSDGSDSSRLAGNHDTDAKGKEVSDIISISDCDSLFSDSTKAEARAATTTTPAHVGAVLVIEDAAFVT